MDRRQAILDYLKQHGTSTARQMADNVGLAKSALGEYLQSMTKSGEIRMEGRLDQRAMTYHYSYEPWRTVHNGTAGDRPIPNQGGQGACAPRTFTSLEYTS